jgi:hypothetical protein
MAKSVRMNADSPSLQIMKFGLFYIIHIYEIGPGIHGFVPVRLAFMPKALSLMHTNKKATESSIELLKASDLD